MQFANVNETWREAQPGMRGVCPICDAEVIAKCGETKMWHWAHLSVQDCDSWSELETPWHREWKGRFPKECREVRHLAANGEVHRADVRTEHGTVLEFQHSYITREERESREHFYSPMAWVVDGSHLKRDLLTFKKALARAVIYDRSPLRLTMPLRSISIAQRWASSSCPTYLDFGDEEFSLNLDGEKFISGEGPILWQIAVAVRVGYCFATPISRQEFIEHHTTNAPLRGYDMPRPPPAPSPLRVFDAYLAARERQRRRPFGG